MKQPQIRCIQDITHQVNRLRSVVALFSGGLDSSYLLKLLRDAGIREVLALAVDVGDDPDTQALRSQANRLGAELTVVDAREEFARDFVVPAIQAQARYLGSYPISSSLSRPLIAKKAMEVAQERGALAIVHSAHPSQNTLRRINGSLELLGFTGAFGTPYELTPIPRSIEAADLANAGVKELADRLVSLDTNLWCREFESGPIDDPEQFTIPEHLYKWTRGGQSIVRSSVAIGYDRGIPVELDGRKLGPVELIAELNKVAGPFRLGRYVGLEHLSTGQKVLEAREMPAAHLLLTGYRYLLSAAVDAEAIREKLHVDAIWVREAVEGRWFGRLRDAAQRFVASISEDVTGTVRMVLSEGYATPISIRSAAPLYIRDRDAWEYESSGVVGGTGGEHSTGDVAVANVRS